MKDNYVDPHRTSYIKITAFRLLDQEKITHEEGLFLVLSLLKPFLSFFSQISFKNLLFLSGKHLNLFGRLLSGCRKDFKNVCHMIVAQKPQRLQTKTS